MITFRYIFIVSNVSVKFGESESCLVDPDKSLVEGMLITEKMEHCKMKLQVYGLNIYFAPVKLFYIFVFRNTVH